MTTERRTAAKLAAPTINLASVVYGLDAYMRSRGADAGDALRRAGLAPGDLTDPDRRVPLIRYLELLEICADLLADPQFGLKFGAQYEPRHVGVVGNVALASRTVGEAFETIGRERPDAVFVTTTPFFNGRREQLVTLAAHYAIPTIVINGDAMLPDPSSESPHRKSIASRLRTRSARILPSSGSLPRWDAEA